MARAITLGKRRNHDDIVAIDLEKVISGHTGIFGMSGAGKSYTLRGLALAFSQTITSHEGKVVIFDVHGDLLPNHPLVSSVKIAQNTDVGLQPFVVNLDPEFGGVQNTIKSFMYSLDSSKKLGTRQLPVLRKMIEDLYKHNGIYADNPKSWRLDWDSWKARPYPKKYPTFEDLIRFVKSKEREMFMGIDGDTTKALNAYLRKSKNLINDIAKNNLGKEGYEDQLKLAKEEALLAYEKFLKNLSTEKVVDELLRYNSRETISSVLDRLETLYYSGIFKNKPIVFEPSKKIHRYDISALSTEDQKLFVNLVLKDEFMKAKQRGFGGKLDTFFILDEAKEFMDDDKDNNMIMKMILEARKFGVAMVLGSQQISHFPDELITNISIKLLLGIDKLHVKSFSNKLQIPTEVLNRIIPKESFLAEIREDGKVSGFIEVEVPKKTIR